MEEDFEKNNKMLQRKKTTKSGKILFLIGLFLVTVFAVFGALFFATRNKGKEESFEWFSRISETKESVLSVVDYAPSDINDLDTGKLEQLNSSISSVKQNMDAIRESKVLDSDEKKTKFEEADKLFAKIQMIGENSEILKKLYDEARSEAGVSDETLKKLSESSCEYIKNLGTKMSDLRGKVSSFKEKYSASGNTIDFVKDYTEIEDILNSFEVSDGSGVGLKEVFGIDRGEISGFYDKIEELNNLVKE